MVKTAVKSCKFVNKSFCGMIRFLTLLLAQILFTFFTQQVYAQESSHKALNKLAPKERIEVLSNLSDTFQEDSLELSITYKVQALEVAQTLGNDSVIALQAEQLADLSVNNGKYAKAIDTYKLAFAIVQKSNDLIGMSRLQRFIGNAFYYTGEYDKALEAHFTSLEFAEKQNNEHGIASAYNNIGLIYMQQQKFDKAVDHYQKAERLFAKLNNTKNQGLALINIGNISYFRSEYQHALEYYQKAYELFSQLNDQPNIALASQNLSITFEILEDYENALQFALKALEIYEATANIFGLTNISRNIGYQYLRMGHFDKAEAYFNKSLEFAKQTSSLNTLSNSYSALWRFYESQGKYEQAFHNLKNQNSIVDSIYKLEVDSKIADLEAKHQLDKKTKEHKWLQRFFILMSVIAALIVLILLFNYRVKVKANKQLLEKNKKIEEQNDELAAINATKNKFFSIIGHDLKNPLSAFIGFMQLIQERIEEMPREEVKTNLKELSLLAENMLELLENLLKWGKSQVGGLDFNPVQSNLFELLGKTLTVVSQNAINKSIEIENKVSNDIFIFADVNMMQTVLRNLISNAIKLSFPEGKIEIFANDNPDSVALFVRDYGVGMSSEQLENLFRIDTKNIARGTANESGTGLGLILCKEFVEFHGGVMEIQSKEGEGSTMGFRLPKRNT